MQPSPFYRPNDPALPATRKELQRHYIEEAKAKADAGKPTESTWAGARQLGVTYGMGVGLYLRLIVW